MQQRLSLKSKATAAEQNALINQLSSQKELYFYNQRIVQIYLRGNQISLQSNVVVTMAERDALRIRPLKERREMAFKVATNQSLDQEKPKDTLMQSENYKKLKFNLNQMQQ